MVRYNKKEYLKYVKGLEDIKDEEGNNIKVVPLSFNLWKEVQPVADEAVGLVNKIVKV